MSDAAPGLPGAGKKPVLGSTDAGEMAIDLERLVATRMLIQAASGGGKSWALRRIIEQTHGQLQQVVIDPEGELVTLADKLDFVVLSADSAEFPLSHTRGADLANLLFKSGRSAVLCLSEFDVEEMQMFVRDFLRALMRQPRETWRPLMVAIDEAQLFAPQQDKAESKKATLDLAARGRKRGICPVVATQRLSQLHKGVVAHLDNKLIGLTTLDVDVERAADQLGMRLAYARQVLRELMAGEFLVYGPALTYNITKVVVGPVITHHGGVSLASAGQYRPSMSTEDLAKQLVALSATEGRDAGDTDVAVPVREGRAQSSSDPRTLTLCMQLASIRMACIAPLLGHGRVPQGHLSRRAASLGLKPHDLRNWMTRFDPTRGLASLSPTRLRPDTLTQIPALEEALRRVDSTQAASTANQAVADKASPAGKSSFQPRLVGDDPGPRSDRPNERRGRDSREAALRAVEHVIDLQRRPKQGSPRFKLTGCSDVVRQLGFAAKNA